MTRLSVVVPIGPGEDAAGGLLAQLAKLPTASSVHMVTCDGRSPPRPDGWSPGIALHHLDTAPGRARQMNAGAAQAAGTWLWFVHADTRLRPDSLPRLLEFITGDTPRLGYFDLCFRADGPSLTALNAWAANRRSRWLGLPFGDQALVLPATAFRALGGFDTTLRRGEDHRLVWQARKAGLPLHPLGARVSTSARRYARDGWMRTSLVHVALTLRQAFDGARHVRRRQP